MPDIFTVAKRSGVMSRIRSKHTLPELNVRKYLHAAGCRFRLHDSKLPGKPDVVFVRKRICLFVHGCFWHGCPKCPDGRRKPKSNRAYWLPKIRRNKQRDKRNISRLRAAGWKVLVIWECESSDVGALKRLKGFILKSRLRQRHPKI
jgi:DNA mismatch endonuclease (patch repair protein)